MQQPASVWTDAAIRDTVDAIARQAAYQQTLGESLWARAVQWVSQIVRRVYDFFAGSDSGQVFLTILFLLLVAAIIARIALGVRDNREQQWRSQRVPMRAGGAHHLTDAERLAARGDYLAAAHALCAALLQACASRGDVRLHPSKTTGDYSRELRRRQASAAPGFQAFRAQYDPLVYGDATVDDADYRALHAAALVVLASSRAA